MATSDRIRTCRQKAGLSQAQLSERLSVSRQAISKWESGAGLPDVVNLQNMARLFDVSVDYLLDDESAGGPSVTVTRQPIDLEAYEPFKAPGKPLGSRHHAAVKAAYPDAERIVEVTRTRKNTPVQEAIEWFLQLFDAPFSIFGTADALHNHDANYLVRNPHQDLLVRVGSHEIETRELSERVEGRKFTIGQDVFRRGNTIV